MSFKKSLLFLLTIASNLGAFAQFDSQRTQLMYGVSVVNPGAIASNGWCNVFGDYRLQWAGFSNAPKDVVVAADLPFSISGTNHGIGVNFVNASAGLFTDQQFTLQYAYRFPLWKGNLGLGVNLGVISQSFDTDEIDFTGNGKESIEGDYYHQTSDVMTPSSDQSEMGFDAGFGAYYSDDQLYIGVSVLHLNRPKFDFGESEEVEIPPIFYLVSGYDFETSNADLHLKPSAVLRTDFSSRQIDLNCVADVKKKVQAGLGYRWRDSFDFLLGATVLDGLFIGYSYDLPVTKMIKSGGSHEFCLRYSFKLDFSRKNGYKSERIL